MGEPPPIAPDPDGPAPEDARDTDRGPPPPIPPEEDFIPVPRTPPAPRKRSGAWNFLILLAVLLGAGVAAGYFFRVPLVLTAPQLNQVFAALGMPVDIYRDTLSFGAPTARRTEDGGLAIAGSFTNEAGQAIDTGYIFFTLNDGSGRTVQFTLTPAPVPTILPGETVDYEHAIGPPDRRAASLGAKMIPLGEAEILLPALGENGLSEPAPEE